jgi:RNA methyltransferase, TrmH family
VDAGLAAGLEPVDLLLAGRDVDAQVLASASELPHPPRVVAVFRTVDLPRFAPRPATLALWRVGDPGNLGTLLRSAEAFGSAVCLSAGCADPTGSKALRASMGAVFRVPVGRFEDAAGRRVALVVHGGTPLTEVELDEPTTFVLGAEREGLPGAVAETCETQATIPVAAGESLNVAMAGTIALWEWWRSRRSR